MTKQRAGIFSVLLAVCILMLTCLTGCDELGFTSGSRSNRYYDNHENVYSVILDVTVKHNMLFSDYDVDVIVDGRNLATMSDGENQTFSLELTQGKHKFRFQKTGDTSFYEDVMVTVNRNDYYSYTIKRHNKLNGGITVTKD